MRVYLTGVQRLGAFEQHFELLVGFIQMTGFFFDRYLKRSIVFMQFRGHMVKGARKQPQLVGQAGALSLNVKITLFHLQAGGNQMVKRGDNLSAYPAQCDHHQQHNPHSTGQ
ncbi:hypothetical protein D3C72_1537620 [compost metagenome]